MSQVSLTFPDGAKRQVPQGTTGLDVAKSIAPSLAKRSVAMSLDGKLADLAAPINKDAAIKFLTRDDAESLELDLIDFGLEEMGEGTGEKDEPQLIIRCAFPDFGHMQKALEERKITPISAELEYIALNPMTLPEHQATQVLELVDTLEQDDDVQKVFHNLG